MELFYDVYGRTEPSEIYLARPGRKITNALNGVDKSTVNLKLNGNNTHKLSFDVKQYIESNGEIISSNDYELIDEMMEIFCCGVWFKIILPPQIDNDGNSEIKHIECESGEIELQQYNLVNFKINCGTEDSCEMLASNNIVTDKNGFSLPKSNVKLYNSKNPELSLVDLILKYAGVPNWHVGVVDRGVYDNEDYYIDINGSSTYQWLEDMVESFDVKEQDVYSFFTSNVASAFRCIIVFNTNDYTINFYRLDGLGKDTNVYIGYRNLQSSFSATRDTSLYTVFTVTGANELGIQYVNFGTSNIEDISYFLNTNYLSQEIINKYLNWQSYRETKRKSYMNYSKQYNKQLGIVSEIEYRVPIDACETDWNTFPDQELQDELSLYQAQVIAYQWLYVDDTGNFDLNALKASSDWSRYKQITEYVIPNIEIQIRNNQIANKDDWEDSITAWETDWDLYGTSELNNKLQSYEDTISTLKKSKFDGTYDPSLSYTEDYFNQMHQKYLDTVALRDQCQTALTQRTNEYNSAESTLNSINSSRTALANEVEISNPNFNFTEEELNIIKKLYNHTNYENTNILVTSIDNTDDEIDEQYKLYLDAKKQLYVESHPQWTYEDELDNLYAIPEFKYMHEQLDIFNFIRIEIRPDTPVKLRVISIEFNPCTLENNLKIGFTTMTNYASKRDDFANLLGEPSAKSSKSIIKGGGSSGIDLEYAVDATFIKKILSSPAFGSYTNNLTENITGAILGGNYISAEGQFGALLEEYVNSGKFAADVANIRELHADSALVNYLKASLITADTINAALIETETIKAINGQFQSITSDVASIGDLLAGNVSAESGQYINLTSANVKISDAVIKELIAAKISVADLMTHSATAELITLISSDGKPSIAFKNATQQFYDSDGNVRVQIGQDANGDFNFIIRGADGTTALFDQNGIKQDGIPNSTIINNMIAEGTIEKDRLGFEIIEPNEYGGIDITKIYDGNGGLFGVEYKTFKETINSNILSLSNNISALSDMVKTIELTGEQVFVDSNGTITPSNITIYATVKNGAVVDKWFIDGTSNTTYVSQDKLSITIPNTFMVNKKSVTIKAQNSDGSVYDIFTIYRVTDGKNGSDSVVGIISSSNGQSFKDDSGITSTVMSLTVYKGTTVVTPNSYRWLQLSDDQTTWTEIGTGQTITVNLNTFTARNRIKCEFDL